MSRVGKHEEPECVLNEIEKRERHQCMKKDGVKKLLDEEETFLFYRMAKNGKQGKGRQKLN